MTSEPILYRLTLSPAHRLSEREVRELGEQYPSLLFGGVVGTPLPLTLNPPTKEKAR